MEKAIAANPVLSEVLAKWDDVQLPSCWVVAGALVQAYWNEVHKFPPLYGVSDVDLIYFDPDDLTEETESHHSARIAELFGSENARFDVKNEARVHLWYESKFGYAIKPYTSSESAIDTFPTTAGCLGVRPQQRGLESYASFGFHDLLNLIVRPNKRQVNEEIYVEKTSRWRELWPLIKIVEWDDEST